METLSARFSALQEKLMEIYESGSDDLETQIEHWRLLREEQVLLHFARKNGIMRIGYQTVPSLAASETKAKTAIGMMLRLQSLQKSEYGQEPWTLVQTSYETFRSPPVDCFKKGPRNIEVYFDGDPHNVMPYTIWTYIYYLTVEDTWEKVDGHVDYDGAYYMEGSSKTYYLTFAADAAKYGKQGYWEVHVNKDTVFAPVTSSSQAAGVGQQHHTTDSIPRPEPTSSSSPQRQRKPTRYGRKTSSPTTTARRKAPKQRQEKNQRSTRSRSSSRNREKARGDTARRERRRGGDSSSRDSSTSSSSSRGGRGRSGGGPTTRSRSRSRSHSRGSPTRVGISPAAVGRSLQSVGRQHNGRLNRLLAEASDPPVILIRGNPNTLKCYRYRARKRHSGGFQFFSTTWSWVGEESCERVGRARMLIAFYSKKQRDKFIETMKLPPNVDWSFGNFDDI